VAEHKIEAKKKMRMERKKKKKKKKKDEAAEGEDATGTGVSGIWTVYSHMHCVICTAGILGFASEISN